MDNRNHYEVLGVSRTAPFDEIQRAFRRIVRKSHPDVNAGKSDEEQKTLEAYTRRAIEAWNILRWPDTRSAYDKTLGTERNNPAQENVVPDSQRGEDVKETIQKARDYLNIKIETLDKIKFELSGVKTLAARNTIVKLDRTKTAMCSLLTNSLDSLQYPPDGKTRAKVLEEFKNELNDKHKEFLDFMAAQISHRNHRR